MDANVAKRIAGSFARGAFQSLDGLLGSKFRHTLKSPQAGDAGLIAKWCLSYPVWLHARVEGGGAVALLLTQSDAASLVARMGGEDPSTRVNVSADDSAMLHELSESLLKGGAAALGGAIRPVEPGYSLGNDSAALSALLGNEIMGTEIAFEDAHGSGTALLVYSGALERRMAGATSGVEEPLVSQDEVRDILGDFRPEDEPDHTPRRNGGPLPDNLDVVMDIELVATARLGKVEVPISEVLNYGPGSIIELGHVVDEPIELLVNGKLIARGDVVVVDERFGLRITEIVSPRERIESLR